MHDVRTITVAIARDWRAVYDFMAVPENVAKWASGLGTLARSGDGWITRTPEGIAMPVRFTPPNAHGVLDHWLSPPAGAEIYIPIRVIANGAGSTVMLTLLRLPGMSDERFAADADWVARDLATLKQLLDA
jgi:hypothetical protein